MLGGSRGDGKAGLPGVEKCWHGLGSAMVGSDGLGSDAEERGGLSTWRDVSCVEMLGVMACWLRWACAPWSEEGGRVDSRVPAFAGDKEGWPGDVLRLQGATWSSCDCC